MSKHRDMPTARGRSIARRVHLTLLVSFFMVRQVVEQGKWLSDKITVLIAVRRVQPLFTSSNFKSAREFISLSVPEAV